MRYRTKNDNPRMQQMAMQSMTPEAVQKLAEQTGEIRDELEAFRKKREGK